MKKIAYLIILLLIVSCKSNNENKPNVSPSVSDMNPAEELTLDKRVAEQAGIKAWKDVASIDFTFNVAKNGDTLTSRAWTWKPKTNEVQLFSKGELIAYNRNQELDSLATSTDRAFINDVYWLLPAYKLVWDQGTQITYPKDQTIQLEYTGDGGYTPGDRYDLKIGKNNEITQWSYYPNGSETPAMTTSFENYNTYNGIRIAHDHKTPDGNLNIFFTDIKVTKTTK